MIILPDNWILPDGLSFTPKGSSYTSNVYDAAQWTLIEASGAVFIPASGWMTPSASNVQMRGRIWTSDQGYSFGWQTNGSWLSSNNRSYRHAVRLVRDISTTVNVTFRGWKNGIENTVLQSAQVPFGTIPSSPTVTEAPMCKRFSGWDKGIVPATGDITYTAQYETVTYSVTVQTTDADMGDVTIEKKE